MKIMGLDITAYAGIKLASIIKDMEASDAYDTHTEIRQDTIEWVEKNFSGRTEGLKAGIYTFADRYGFRAGSYSGYGIWRSQLSFFAHGKTSKEIWESDVTTGDFMELINFADNEGVIGPVVSKKLAKDFEDNRAAIFAKTGDGDYFRAKYDDWAKAFALASNNGFIDFH
jgi:hypothetical protein